MMKLEINNEVKYINFLENTRWPDGVECTVCRCRNIIFHNYKNKNRFYQCKKCNYVFSVKVGTVFDKSGIPLSKWFLLINIICSQQDIVINQVYKIIKVNRNTARNMICRIQLAMHVDKEFYQNFYNICKVN